MGNWCFPHGLVAMKLMTSADEEHVNRDAIYSFFVRNVSLADISKQRKLSLMLWDFFCSVYVYTVCWFVA